MFVTKTVTIIFFTKNLISALRFGLLKPETIQQNSQKSFNLLNPIKHLDNSTLIRLHKYNLSKPSRSFLTSIPPKIDHHWPSFRYRQTVGRIDLLFFLSWWQMMNLGCTFLFFSISNFNRFKLNRKVKICIFLSLITVPYTV